MPPLISPSTTSTDRSSLRTIREQLGRILGLYVTGDVSSLAASLEAERWVISTALQSDAATHTRFDGLFLGIRDGAETGEVRRLVDGTYEPTNGAVYMDRAFDTVIQLGTTFELSVLPPLDAYLGVKSLNECINEGLESLPLLDLLQFTSDGTQRIALENYDWPIKSVGQVYQPLTNADDPLIESWVRATLTFDGDTPYLQLSAAFATGQVFTVAVQRPANTWIGTLGVWATTSTGLVADTDECMYHARTVAAVAEPLALRALAASYPRDSKERVAALAEADHSDIQAAYSSFYNRPRTVRQSARTRPGWGGTWWWNR